METAPAFTCCDEIGVNGRFGDVEVHSRIERLARRVVHIMRHMMRGHEHLDAVVIGGDVAVEAPLLAQHFIQQPVIDVRGHAVDFVVGGHDAAYVRFLHGGLKRRKKIFADDALRVVAGRGVGAAFGHAVHREVFRRRQHVMAIDEESIALQTLNRGDAHA